MSCVAWFMIGVATGLGVGLLAGLYIGRSECHESHESVQDMTVTLKEKK